MPQQQARSRRAARHRALKSILCYPGRGWLEAHNSRIRARHNALSQPVLLSLARAVLSLSSTSPSSRSASVPVRYILLCSCCAGRPGPSFASNLPQRLCAFATPAASHSPPHLPSELKRRLMLHVTPHPCLERNCLELGAHVTHSELRTKKHSELRSNKHRLGDLIKTLLAITLMLITLTQIQQAPTLRLD